MSTTLLNELMIYITRICHTHVYSLLSLTVKEITKKRSKDMTNACYCRYAYELNIVSLTDRKFELHARNSHKTRVKLVFIMFYSCSSANADFQDASASTYKVFYTMLQLQH